MSFLKLLLAFSPWISFLIIGHGSLLRLKIGLGVALALSIIMGVARLHRGIILYVGLIFFASAAIPIGVLNSFWTAKHMGILANGALAFSSWMSIALRKPFTLDYAREHTDPKLWESPAFIRTNMIVTALWSLAFSTNTALAWGKMENFFLPEWSYEIISYAILAGVAVFTTWYPNHIRGTVLK